MSPIDRPILASTILERVIGKGAAALELLVAAIQTGQEEPEAIVMSAGTGIDPKVTAAVVLLMMVLTAIAAALIVSGTEGMSPEAAFPLRSKSELEPDLGDTEPLNTDGIGQVACVGDPARVAEVGAEPSAAVAVGDHTHTEMVLILDQPWMMNEEGRLKSVPRPRPAGSVAKIRPVPVDPTLILRIDQLGQSVRPPLDYINIAAVVVIPGTACSTVGLGTIPGHIPSPQWAPLKILIQPLPSGGMRPQTIATADSAVAVGFPRGTMLHPPH